MVRLRQNFEKPREIMLKTYIGDKAFYRRVLAIGVPIFMQNLITNFVSMLDNLMVGQLGTLPMSGVAIVNQLLFIFNLVVFGISSGTGIFTAQFYGSGDETSIRHTLRFKIVACTLFSLVCVGVFALFDEQLIRLFLMGEGSAADAVQILEYGKDYLWIMLLGLIPFAISSAYSTTLRECGETFVPMLSSFGAMFCNLILNYILIFGHFGAPALGASGAAVATVVSRYLEMVIVSLWPHFHLRKYGFLRGLYRSLHIPGKLMKQLLIKVSPLIINEALWSGAVTFQNQCFSTCGLEVVSALNIVTTLNNLAIVVSIAMGNTVGILMGQMLGAGIPGEQVRSENRKLTACSVVCGFAISLLMVVMAPFFPKFYNTTSQIWALATGMILLLSLAKPVQSYHLCVYYTIRSGGQAILTFLYDCGFMCLVNAPVAFVVCHFSNLPFLTIYGICLLPELIHAVIGGFLIKKDGWIKNLTLS